MTSKSTLVHGFAALGERRACANSSYMKSCQQFLPELSVHLLSSYIEGRALLFVITQIPRKHRLKSW